MDDEREGDTCMGMSQRVDGTLKRYMCMFCGFIYDEAAGHPESGIAPGTKWEDVPADWICPDCGNPKSAFEMEEI